MRPLAPLRQPLLATRVADQLREAIVYGELKLGDAVSEDRLATMLGVSRTPVREALSTLAVQGLIEIRPQRGSFVFHPTSQDVAEVCEYRAIIEVQAMHLAAARSHSQMLAAMTAADAAQQSAEAAGAVVDAARADAAFHEALIAHCGNSLLEQAYLLVSGRVGAIRFFARRSISSRAASSHDHAKIIEALMRGDLAQAETTLTGHIMRMQLHFSERQAATAVN